ncbi:MAG: SDR family NAD(P)-dependent oxidoreductase [Alphaproteobacteria bacterium]
MNAINLNGRNAIVTGAARGIGHAIAERFLRSGASVDLWDMDNEQLAKAAKALAALGRVRTAVVDVTDSALVEKTALDAERHWGRIDILVNNAGITGPRKSSVEHTDGEWRACIDILLSGTFYCSRAVVRGMLKNRYGRVVNMASVSGKEGSPLMPAYSAAKAGVIGLTKAMGKEYAETGVLFNCITPATIETDLIRSYEPSYKAFALSRTPMNRYGTVEEIAALAAWLASEECSFSTAGVFDASGGRSSY